MNEYPIPQLNSPPPPDKKDSHFTTFSKRVWAFNIDLVCIFFINKGVVGAFHSTIKNFYYQLNTQTQVAIEQNIHNISMLSFFIVFFGYFIFSYYLGEGKTPGKHFMGISAYPQRFQEDGDIQLTLKESFLRTLGHIVSLIFIIPFAVCLLNKEKKSVSDFISQTELLSDEELAKKQEFFYKKKSTSQMPATVHSLPQLELEFPSDLSQEAEKKAS